MFGRAWSRLLGCSPTLAMNAVALLDTLTDLTPREAERWIAAALGEAAALHERDGALYAPPNDAPALANAERLHEAWAAWAAGADAVLTRVRAAFGTDRQHLAGLFDLRFERANAGALLALSPRAMLRRIASADAGEGKVYANVGELRRERAVPRDTRRSA